MSKHNLALADQAPEIYYPESDGKPMAETDVHRSLIMALIEALEIHFQADPDVYVSGNILLYYEKDKPNKSVSPDVLFVRGVPKGQRRVYKLWEEGRMPEAIFEISSRSTWGDDWHIKFQLYARLGVKEYFLFDPEYDYLPEPLIAFRLKDGEYKKLQVRKNRVHSEVMGLDLVDTGETLRLYHPPTARFLPTLAEETVARAQAEAARAQAEAARAQAEAARAQAEAIAEAETHARQQAEAEIKRLQAELARLQNPS
jgi:Uma2 family endonuclease